MQQPTQMDFSPRHASDDLVALDIKTYAMALLRRGYRDSTKRNMPERWFDELPHTHGALDDAIEQGALFCNMLAENLKPGR